MHARYERRSAPVDPDALPSESADEEVVLAIDAAAADVPGDPKVQLLNRVRSTLRNAPDLDRLLAGIVETVRGMLSAKPERVRVELLDDRGACVRSAGFDERGGDAASVPLSATVRTRVLRDRQALVVADAAGAFGPAAGSVKRLRIGSLLAVPFVGRDGVLGGVFAYHGGDRAPFSRSDLEVVTALAGLLAYEVEARRLRDALARDNEDLRLRAAEADIVVGTEPRALAMLRAAEKAAASDLSILLVGESGTGKELVAHAVHARSSRASCSATSAARSRVPRATDPGASPKPTAAPSSSTRSATSPPTSSRSSCARSRRGRSRPSAATRRARWTCA